MRVPAYDKTAHGGRGDRSPHADWPEVTGPLDLVLIDGWCLAVRPLDEAALPDPALEPVNASLAEYARWQRHIDALAVWRAKELEQIVDWRVEAEERSRAAGRPGLDRASSEDYIRRFLPVYAAYGPTSTHEPPRRARQLEVVLDANRLPV
jgi:D-glycerate 3-kinase